MLKYQLAYKRNKTQNRASSLKRGIVVLQVILVLPILLIVTLAGIQLALVMQLQQSVSSAVLEGAHAAAYGENFPTVVDAVGRILEVHGIDLNDEDSYLIELERFGEPVRRRGRSDFAGERSFPPLHVGEIRVNLFLAISDGNGRPVPDWLRTFGFSWSHRVLSGTATMTAE